MYFSEIIGQIGKGNYIFDKNNQVILEIVEGKIKIQFYPENAKVICNSEEVEVSLEQFSDFTFEERESEVDGEENQVALLFNNDEILVCTESKSSTIQALFELFSNLFDDEVECSPKFQVEKLIDDLSIDCEKDYNPSIWKILLQYNKKIEKAFDEGDFKPNSKIFFFLEEESGKIANNLGETAKKSFSNLVKNFNGFGSLVQAGIGIAKAAGTRIAKGMVNNLFSEKNIMLLTNQNVVLIKKDEICSFDFDEVGEIFEARQDETLAGVVDIFDETDELILSNISQNDWNLFKKELRNLKKSSAQNISMESSEEEDEFTIAQKKILKLKMMLDNGIITQEDFDAKKAEILSTI
ncbi:MAG: SHOCT domain-containing protein [Spirochaetaceae bacterium]|nr:SHOCT domain-containing protein [Spirochaetaceae bacterium]